MNPLARQAIEIRLNSPIQEIRGVSGGDINEAHCVQCADGRQLFIKTNPRAPQTMFEREAKGLEWLAGKHGLRVPKVICHSEPHEPAYLILEWIAPTRRVATFDETLGIGLAKLHLDTPNNFGWHTSNFIGHLHQGNKTESTWAHICPSGLGPVGETKGPVAPPVKPARTASGPGPDNPRRSNVARSIICCAAALRAWSCVYP